MNSPVQLHLKFIQKYGKPKLKAGLGKTLNSEFYFSLIHSVQIRTN